MSPVPKKSVTQEMMEECRPGDPECYTEYTVDKKHMPLKSAEKSFLEMEFSRRLLAKAAKERV